MPGFTQAIGLIGHMWQRLFTKCATHSLAWSSASNNLVGYLTVGNLVGTGVTIGDYCIEWRLGSTTGTIILTTGIDGNADDTSIQRYHPFTNEPVVSGNLYAVIKYVYIDGVRYSPYFMQGQYSPDLKTCLGYITVVAMNCTNGGTGNYYDYAYSHRVTYNNTIQSSSLASRTIRFDLNADGTTTGLAWQFQGNQIADRIRLYYVSGQSETLMDDWVVGSDNSATDYTSSPKKFDDLYFSKILNFASFTYTSGDYIKIQIDPSYNSPSNTNTNWDLYLKCFTDSVPFDCSYLDNDVNNLGSTDDITMTWDEVNCQYVCSIPTVSSYTSTQVQAEAIFKYIQHLNYTSTDFTSPQLIRFTRRTDGYKSHIIIQGNYQETSQTYTIAKTGNQVVFQFQNSTDYNIYKNSYNTTLANSHFTDYSTDGTSILHYKGFEFVVRIANSLGDAYTTLSVYIWYGSTFTFNDGAYSITIDLISQVNEYAEATCNNVHTAIDSVNTQYETFKNLANFSYTTKIVQQYPLYGLYWYTISQNLTQQDFYVATSLNDSVLNGACSLGDDWHLVNGWWWFYKIYVKVVITNNTDPINNYQVYSKLNADGSVASSWTLIKQVP